MDVIARLDLLTHHCHIVEKETIAGVALYVSMDGPGRAKLGTG
jgi:hypothetical protein